jgi:hypothetical protein
VRAARTGAAAIFIGIFNYCLYTWLLNVPAVHDIEVVLLTFTLARAVPSTAASASRRRRRRRCRRPRHHRSHESASFNCRYWPVLLISVATGKGLLALRALRERRWRRAAGHQALMDAVNEQNMPANMHSRSNGQLLAGGLFANAPRVPRALAAAARATLTRAPPPPSVPSSTTKSV